MKVSSKAFEHKKPIPKKYTCQGEDINPPLTLDDLPPETRSLVLIVDDPDAPAGVFVHWVVYDIVPCSEIEENSIPGTQGKNDFQRQNYGGPCPPSGTHRYFFKVYALDKELGLPKGATKKEIEDHIKDCTLAYAELIGLYQKS